MRAGVGGRTAVSALAALRWTILQGVLKTCSPAAAINLAQFGVQVTYDTLKLQWCSTTIDRDEGGTSVVQSGTLVGWTYLDVGKPIPGAAGSKTYCGPADITDGYYQTLSDEARSLQVTFWLPCQKTAAATDPHKCCTNQAVVSGLSGHPAALHQLSATLCTFHPIDPPPHKELRAARCGRVVDCDRHCHAGAVFQQTLDARRDASR